LFDDESPNLNTQPDKKKHIAKLSMLNMTSETIITKDGKPAVLADGVAGEPVRGAYRKNKDGKLNAVTVRFGGSTGVEKKKPAN